VVNKRIYIVTDDDRRQRGTHHCTNSAAVTMVG